MPPKDARAWLRIGTSELSFGRQVGAATDDTTAKRLSQCVPLEIQYGGNVHSESVTLLEHPEVSDDNILRVGDLQLKTGVIVRGRVVDAKGNGLSKVHLTSTGPRGPHSGREAISGEDGKFEFPAMAPGNLTVHPNARLRIGQETLPGTASPRDVQAVFATQSFTIFDFRSTHQITIRAVPHTEVAFNWVDRREDQTQPIADYGAFRVRGHVPNELGKRGVYWTSETYRVERDGKFVLKIKIPTNLLKPELILPADSKVTASYSDSAGVTSGPGYVPLGDITQPTPRTIYGDEPHSNKAVAELKGDGSN